MKRQEGKSRSMDSVVSAWRKDSEETGVDANYEHDGFDWRRIGVHHSMTSCCEARNQIRRSCSAGA